MAYEFNPFTTTLDKIRSFAVLDDRYLLIDQSTPQTVISGTPVFNVGLKANDDIVIRGTKKLVFDGS